MNISYLLGDSDGLYSWDANTGFFTCTLCNKSFQSKGNFNRHMRTTHTANQEVSCDVCGHIFKNVVSLRQHMRRTLHGKQNNLNYY